MSSIAQAPGGERPTTVTAAAGLIVLFAAMSALYVLTGSGGSDPVFLTIAFTLIAFRLIAVVGLWGCRRWGAILGFVVTLIDTLLALPGLFDGTVAGGLAMATVSIAAVIGVVTLILLLLPTSRRAYV